MIGKKKKVIALVLIIFVVCIICVLQVIDIFRQEPLEVTVKLEQPEFFLSEAPSTNNLYKCLDYYDIHHKDIVVSQAILETGKFRSRLCKENNNLFGLYNSRKKEYLVFTHWTESVEAYKKYIQYRYKPDEDYYRFLKRIRYAEDSLYTKKVKLLTNKLKTNVE